MLKADSKRSLATFKQTTIDLGAYVDALGQSVLRIHNVQITYSDNAGTSSTIGANAVGVAQWQLTTQSQVDKVSGVPIVQGIVIL